MLLEEATWRDRKAYIGEFISGWISVLEQAGAMDGLPLNEDGVVDPMMATINGKYTCNPHHSPHRNPPRILTTLYAFALSRGGGKGHDDAGGPELEREVCGRDPDEGLRYGRIDEEQVREDGDETDRRCDVIGR